MYLYHYYNKNTQPFLNLSDLTLEEAKKTLNKIRTTNPDSFCAKRSPDYMENRLYYENILREEFRKKGGKIDRIVPHYMTVEHSPGSVHGTRIVLLLKFLLKSLCADTFFHIWRFTSDI